MKKAYVVYKDEFVLGHWKGTSWVNHHYEPEIVAIFTNKANAKKYIKQKDDEMYVEAYPLNPTK